MEEKLCGEQPENDTFNVQSEIVEIGDMGTASKVSQDGSLGKFKDAESMLKAYNSLQAEFTRKCQKLSEYEKMYENKEKSVDANCNVKPKLSNENGLDISKTNNIEIEKDNLMTSENFGQSNEDLQANKTNEVVDNKTEVTLENEEKFLENNTTNESNTLNFVSAKKIAENSEEKAKEPIFKSEIWKQKVAEFLAENEVAKEYSKQISNEIIKDESLQNDPNCLELAWARVMKKEFSSPKALSNDAKFITEQILSQDMVKQQVLKEYFMALQSKKTPPLIASSGKVANITQTEPKNMEEAKNAVARLFNLKGN